MDIEAYRKDFLAQIEKEQAEAQQVSSEDMLNYANRDEHDNETLCGMIRRIPLDAENFAASVRSLLDVLGNNDVGAGPRLAAIEQLGAAEFQPVGFKEFRAEYMELLRRLAISEDKNVRVAVLDRLTLENDPEAQRLLRESLEKSRKPLIPDAKAVQLLARDDHAGTYPLFRRLAAEGTGAVREEALRALASDVQSVQLFESIASNKSEKSPLRQIASVNLKTISPDRYARVAENVLLDDGDDDKLRAMTANVIAHNAEVATELRKSDRLSAAIEGIGSRTNSRSLKSSIGRLTKSLASK